MTRSMAILIGLIAGLSLLFQAWQLHRFVAAGPRFTAQDGQILCERVAELERRLNIAERPCYYAKP